MTAGDNNKTVQPTRVCARGALLGALFACASSLALAQSGSSPPAPSVPPAAPATAAAPQSEPQSSPPVAQPPTVDAAAPVPAEKSRKGVFNDHRCRRDAENAGLALFERGSPLAEGVDFSQQAAAEPDLLSGPLGR